MIILKTAAFLLPLIGLGGIAGAAETGTSPVNSVIVFCAGCLVMLLYIKLDKAVCWKDEPATRGKERMGMEKFASRADELKEMCQPIISYLEKHCDPYTEVHISMDGIKVTSVQCGIPVRTKDD